MLTLISHHLCPYVQRVAIALAEKQIPFERIYVDLAAKPDWFLTLAVTPYTTSRPFRPPGVNAEPRARKAAAVPGPSRRRKTHAQRQVRCGAATTMIRQAVDPQTGELGRPRWERSLPLPFESARAAAGRVVDTSPDALLRDIFRLPPERVSAA